MKNLNPSVKLIALTVLTLEAAFVKSTLLNLLIFAVCITAAVISDRKNIKTCALLMLPVLLSAVGMFFTGYRFSSDMPINGSNIAVTDSNFQNGLLLASRVLCFAGAMLLFSLTTDRAGLIRSFMCQLKLPPVFSYGILAAYGIFPFAVREYKQLRLNFKSRGIRVSPVSPRVLRPLLVKAVRWSEALSAAMESKGFDSRKKRDLYNPPAVRTADTVFLSVCIITPWFIPALNQIF